MDRARHCVALDIKSYKEQGNLPPFAKIFITLSSPLFLCIHKEIIIRETIGEDTGQNESLRNRPPQKFLQQIDMPMYRSTVVIFLD